MPPTNLVVRRTVVMCPEQHPLNDTVLNSKSQLTFDVQSSMNSRSMENGSEDEIPQLNVTKALSDDPVWKTSSRTSTAESNSHSVRNSNSNASQADFSSQFWSYEHSSEQSQHENASCEESVNGGATAGEDSVVSADQERQLLLLMLLAQVCALHDPTPRTFTVHVLELFERGILDRESIRFLFDLGLVPAAGSPTNFLLFEPTTNVPPPDSRGANLDDSLHATSTSLQKWTRDIVPVLPALDRAREASAIRILLQRHESREIGSKKEGFSNSASHTSSPTALGKNWKVENHPLYLSRYQREFTQIRLLAGGSFGQVFQATSKQDGRDYAVKQVAFSATGYSNESVTQVIREVRCLAHCDHPNCVRYYTSWLEPSWMTGSGTAIAPDQIASKQMQQKLLTDLNHLVMSKEARNCSSRSEESFSFDRNQFEASSCSLRHRRRFSFGSSLDDSIESLGNRRSDMWSKSGRSKDDSFLSWGRSDAPPSHTAKTNGPRKQNPPPKAYRYQICLFIQMQLCLPMTLADWIRQRNQSSVSHDHAARIGPAIDIVTQLLQGLAHVHAKDIIHRDLKPGNIFAGDDGNFRIGDFGLSKLLQSAKCDETWTAGGGINGNSLHKRLLPSASANDLKGKGSDTSSWAEPLTAGVGTASYAAPEQVSSDSYGSEVDVFSLGLIMLELVCCFDTEHERIQIFQDCRRGKLPSWLTTDYPSVASLIKQCTDKHPKNRPSAQVLLSSDLIDPTRPSAEVQETVEQLRIQLKEKEGELEQHKNVIAEKDRIIEELQLQMKRFSGSDFVATLAEQSAMENADLGVSAVASYSSDDDY